LTTADTSDRFDPAAYWDARLATSSELADVGHWRLGEQFNVWMYRIRRRVFRRAVTPHLATIRTAIDIGAGSGFYIDQWHEFGIAQVRACDIAKPALERLCRKYPEVEFAQLDIGDPPQTLPEWRANAISAFDLMFHIVDDARFERALRNMFSLLEPGGILFLTDNLISGPTQRNEHHVSRNRAEIVVGLRSAGFEILASHPSFVLMNEPVDRAHPLHLKAWSLLARVLRRQPALGNLLGAMLFPLELVAVRAVRRSPSTELLVCRRPL
jgi:SAM-dependent methyltransferase